MSAAQYLEVVQTEDGEVLLRRSEAEIDADEAEPLVSLRFSPEVRAMLGAHLNEVALAMLGAGLRASSALARQQNPDIEVEVDGEEVPRLLH